MKKILFICRNLGMCGNERMMITYISALYKHADIYVLCLKNQEHLKVFLPKSIKYINLQNQINVEYLEEVFDVEIATSEFTPHEWLMTRQTTSKKILMLSTCLWENSEQKIKKLQESLYIYDKYIFVSQFQYNKFINNFQNIEQSKCHVIPNMIDKNYINKLSEEPINYTKKGFTIGIFGRLSPEKKLIEILHIIHNLKINLPIYILYVGSGIEKEYILKMSKKLNLIDKVEIVDFTINPFPYMKLCDIVLSTSTTESFGLTMLEAILLKKYPLTNYQGAKVEVLQNGKLGFIYNNINEASKYIQDIYENSSTIIQVKQNIEKYIIHYDYNIMIKMFWNILVFLCEDK